MCWLRYFRNSRHISQALGNRRDFPHNKERPAWENIWYRLYKKTTSPCRHKKNFRQVQNRPNEATYYSITQVVCKLLFIWLTDHFLHHLVAEVKIQTSCFGKSFVKEFYGHFFLCLFTGCRKSRLYVGDGLAHPAGFYDLRLTKFRDGQARPLRVCKGWTGLVGCFNFSTSVNSYSFPFAATDSSARALAFMPVHGIIKAWKRKGRVS